jgi:hypothetical protein
MRSIHRVGLTIAGIVAALAVAGAFVVDGYLSAQTAAAQATAAQQAATAAATLQPTLDPQTIYIQPAATPPVLTQPSPPVLQPIPPFRVEGGDDGGGDN